MQLASVVNNISQNPAYQAYQPKLISDELASRNRTIVREHVPHPLAFPFLASIRKGVIDHSVVAAVRMFIESEPSFVQEYGK